MKNADRLIEALKFSKMNGVDYVDFYVGRYTGNGPSVVPALRRRGYKVEYFGHALYRLSGESK